MGIQLGNAFDRTGAVLGIFVKKVLRPSEAELEFQFIAGQSSLKALESFYSPKPKKPASLVSDPQNTASASVSSAASASVSPAVSAPEAKSSKSVTKKEKESTWNFIGTSPSQTTADEIMKLLTPVAIACVKEAGLELNQAQLQSFSQNFSSQSSAQLQQLLNMFQAQSYTRGAEENRQKSSFVALEQLL